MWTLGILAQEMGIPLTAGGADVQPFYMTAELLEYRTFARLWDAVKGETTEKPAPDHPMTPLVRDIMGERMAERMRQNAARFNKGGKKAKA